MESMAGTDSDDHRIESEDLNREDPKLLRAAKLAKAALQRLYVNGHSDGCSCNLCTAARLILSSLEVLDTVVRHEAGQSELFDE